MKKNLRIVSAAAAALLAVAPIAAAGVAPAATVMAATVHRPTVNPNVPVNGTVVLDRATNTPFSVKLSDGQKEAILQKCGLNGNVQDMSNIKVVSATSTGADGKFVQTIQFDFNNQKWEVKVNARFASQQGTPYFYNKKNNTVVNNGATVTFNDLANGFTPTSLLNEINNGYGAKTSDASGTDATITTTASDVESQLVQQGLKRASNGDFEYPANGFNLKLTARSDNGQTATINVRINASVNYDAPAFVVAGKVYYNNNLTPDGKTAENIVLDTHYSVSGKDTDVISNGKVNNDAVYAGVLAYVQSADRNVAAGHDTTAAELNAHQQLLNKSDVNIDSSNVNSKVAGIYPVIITAKNPAGYTSKLVVKVIVNGPETKAPSEYVKNDGVKVYNINGNNVTEDTSVKPLVKGASIYTFGKVTVNGVEYTRIDSKDSNEFVKSSDLQATPVNVTPATVASQSKTIMHAAYLYDKNGKRVGTDVLHAYNSVSVAEHTTTINGKAYYEVIKNGQASGNYIAAGNLDGSMRKLRHNAYVYNTKGHRVKSEGTKKKGTSMRTYGAALNYRGHKMYRVAQYRYVKAANF